MAAKKTQSTKNAKRVAKENTEPFQPMRVTFGVATLAAVTLVVFALILAVQISE